MAVPGVLLTAAVLTLAACTQAPSPTRRPVPLAAEHARDSQAVYLQWLGISSWVMSRGDDVVVLDPFFSRPTFGKMVLSLLHLTRNFGSDPERIRAVLPALPRGTRAVLVGHAHYDHLMDVPYYLRDPSGAGVIYVGSRTAELLLRTFKPTEMQFQVPRGAEPIEAGRVAIRGFASDHAPHIFGITFMHSDGDITEEPPAPPTRAGEWLDGVTQLYLVDFRDASGAVAFRILATGAANSEEGAATLRAARAVVQQESTDVAILCVPGWDKVDRYPESVLRELRHRDAQGEWRPGPRHVVLSHYDNIWGPYKPGEDPNGEIDFVMFARYHRFVDKLRGLKSTGGYPFTIAEPRTGECLAFPSGGTRVGCER